MSVTAASEIGAACSPRRQPDDTGIADRSSRTQNRPRAGLTSASRQDGRSRSCGRRSAAPGRTAKGSAESTKHIFAFSHGAARGKVFVCPSRDAEEHSGSRMPTSARRRPLYRTPPYLKSSPASSPFSRGRSVPPPALKGQSQPTATVSSRTAGVPTLSGSDDLPGWRGTVIIDPTTAMCGRGSLRVDGTATLSAERPSPAEHLFHSCC